jgi:hypothetical protein
MRDELKKHLIDGFVAVPAIIASGYVANRTNSFLLSMITLGVVGAVLLMVFTFIETQGDVVFRVRDFFIVAIFILLGLFVAIAAALLLIITMQIGGDLWSWTKANPFSALFTAATVYVAFALLRKLIRTTVVKLESVFSRRKSQRKEIRASSEPNALTIEVEKSSEQEPAPRTVRRVREVVSTRNCDECRESWSDKNLEQCGFCSKTVCTRCLSRTKVLGASGEQLCCMRCAKIKPLNRISIS